MSYITRRALSTLIPPKVRPSGIPVTLNYSSNLYQVASPSVSGQFYTESTNLVLQ